MEGGRVLKRVRSTYEWAQGRIIKRWQDGKHLRRIEICREMLRESSRLPKTEEEKELTDCKARPYRMV